MTLSLSEIKRKNKEAGQHFFEKGNPPVKAKYGNYLVTQGIGGGWVIYKFDESNAHLNLVDNKDGEYSFQSYENFSDAVKYAKELARKE